LARAEGALIMDTLHNMPRYPAYKDSGVEWLGEIPEGWDAIKMKYLFKNTSIKNKPNKTLLSVTQNQGVVPRSWVENRMVMPSGNLESFKFISKGDFAISLRSFEGGLEYCYHDGIISPAYTALKSKRTDLFSSYYRFLFKSSAFISELQISIIGIREGKNISYEELQYSLLPIPPLPEQQAIANFLDEKTGKIDEAIAIKQQQIELLKERKQIIIQNAVTRGLNPDAPLRDSGIDWIGKIPEHWEVKQLKFIVFMQSGETIKPEQFCERGYPVYGGNGFRGFTSKYTNEGEYALIGRQGALCGNVNYATGKFFASEHAIVTYTLNNENVSWIGETIKICNLNRFSQSAAQPGIAVNVIKDILFPYPPTVEQEQISKFLNEYSGKTDAVITLQQQQIDRLKEYKTTLINSAVTGKIKVID